MHKLLSEQIERYLGGLENATDEVRKLLREVDVVYREADLMRVRIEKSRDNNSEELFQRHDRLEEEIHERTQAQQELQLYAKRLKALHDIDRAILNAGSPEEIASESLDRLIEVIGTSWASVLLTDFSTGKMKEICTRSKVKLEGTISETFALVDPQNSKLKEGVVHAVADMSAIAEPSSHEIELINLGLKSYMLVPLIARDHLVGLLELADVEVGVFDQEATQIAQEVASQVAVSVQQAALLDEVQRLNENLEQRIRERTSALERRANEISLLNDMGEKLHSCVTSIEAYQVIAQNVPKIFPQLQFIHAWQYHWRKVSELILGFNLIIR